MNLDEIKGGQFVGVKLRANPRNAPVGEIVPGRWPPGGLKAGVGGCRRPDRMSLSAVIFAGTEDQAKAAFDNYQAIKTLRAPAMAKAHVVLAEAENALSALREQIEQEACAAAAGRVQA